MLPHPLTNFEIQRYYQNKPRFNGVFSRNNLPKIKDGTYIINLDQYKPTETHLIALYLISLYFDSFGVKYIPKETEKFVGKKNVAATIYRIQTYDSIICGYFCVDFFFFFLY